ncbi:MAG: F0F1 ATP synthase subunit A [Proteobacteria bacterium]|jgi:F-type H+-transporting ATPase subunit a|nr:F0F1 ATP synthase subunit A [Pseudomonadota bacterium]
MKHPFTFFEHYLPGVTHENLFLVTSIFVTLLLVLFGVMIYPRIKNAANNVVPSKKINLSNIGEILFEFLANTCDDVIGHGGRKYLPYVGTLFIFILTANLIGMIPGFLPPTEVWQSGAALALISFITFNYYGFKEHGIGYLKHFAAPVKIEGIKNPIALLALYLPLFLFQVLFISVESISTILRPITLTIRLMVNISADHTVLGIFSSLIPYLVPLPFMVLGLFVCFIQAFVFTMLTMVYISMATAHEH